MRADGALDGEPAHLAAALHGLADQIDGAAPRLEDRLASMWADPGPGRHDPVGGTENPLAPPVQLWVQPDGSLRGHGTLGLAYQDPRGHVHGGTSAMLLDRALGIANARAGHPAITVGLDLSCRAAIPVRSTVTITSRHESVEGRKVRSSGGLRVGDLTCVTSTGTFVLLTDPSTSSMFTRPAAQEES